MSVCTLVSNTPTEIVVRHDETGHVFRYRIEGENLMLGPVTEGAGAKDPGDVAADAHAFARQELRRLGSRMEERP